MATPESYDVILSIGELIDMLVTTNVKIAQIHQNILAERRKPEWSASFIAAEDEKCRRAAEKRVLLRDEITKRIDEAIRRGGVQVSPDVRTFDLKGMT